MDNNIKDVKPQTAVASLSNLHREEFLDFTGKFDINLVGEVVGMSTTFIRKVVGHNRKEISPVEVLHLLDQDAFAETYVLRSRIPAYLISRTECTASKESKIDFSNLDNLTLLAGNAYELIPKLPPKSVQCTVTSTPYWAMRLYDAMVPVAWADGDVCAFGMEQTPEAFIRHSVELLSMLKPAMTDDGSVWWNIMDTFNTRTQIRNNASEALYAMQGKDKRGWTEHTCRRYSAGHSYLKDGEQCLIPTKIAERASRIGYYLKTLISWVKTSTLPEPQNSRVSRNIEYILHLSLQRTPKFCKEAYRNLPSRLGGRNGSLESDKLSDFWYLPTSLGRDGHGAQFPLALPGRCIGLSTDEGDLVLDPFFGAGNSAIAAQDLKRRFVGFDISDKYVEIARYRVANLGNSEGSIDIDAASSQMEQSDEAVQGSLL